jgi:hypothetical protein
MLTDSGESSSPVKSDSQSTPEKRESVLEYGHPERTWPARRWVISTLLTFTVIIAAWFFRNYELPDRPPKKPDRNAKVLINPLEKGVPNFPCDDESRQFVISVLQRKPIYEPMLVKGSYLRYPVPYCELFVGGTRYYCDDNCIFYQARSGRFTWTETKFAELVRGLEVSRKNNHSVVRLVPDPK